MELIRSPAELARLESLRGHGPLVLVPTMGALHEGHASLVRLAREHGQPVVSIFVNPAQFGPGEDYARYPRDLDADLALLAETGAGAVFVPYAAAMYPAGVGVTVQPGPRAAPLCGAARPGHFAGVLTVVAKLFLLVRPEAAVFGRKDAQQLLVIDEMVRDLGFPVRLIEAPTVRDADGLALSSRNRYLDGPARRRALGVPRALAAAERAVRAGERGAAAVAAAMRAELAEADRVDYAEARSLPDLGACDRLGGRVLLAVAARYGATRLIDNLALRVAERRVEACGLLAAPGAAA